VHTLVCKLAHHTTAQTATLVSSHPCKLHYKIPAYALDQSKAPQLHSERCKQSEAQASELRNLAKAEEPRYG
jgi:hypothetical protein